ncbi:MAG: PDZ domain-containing protein, partial [Thermodesulfobacteriota bacterium]
FTNGKPDGLTLTRIRRNSIFRRLGLRNGDIITGVDGEPIESVDDALKFYNNLKSASDVSLEIKRRGRGQKMEYSIR